MRLTNVDGSLLLVSSEHPYFDVGTPQGGDALRNTLQEGRGGEVVCRKHSSYIPNNILELVTSAGHTPHQLGACHISWAHATSAGNMPHQLETCHISWAYNLWPKEGQTYIKSVLPSVAYLQ